MCGLFLYQNTALSLVNFRKKLEVLKLFWVGDDCQCSVQKLFYSKELWPSELVSFLSDTEFTLQPDREWWPWNWWSASIWLINTKWRPWKCLIFENFFICLSLNQSEDRSKNRNTLILTCKWKKLFSNCCQSDIMLSHLPVIPCGNSSILGNFRLEFLEKPGEIRICFLTVSGIDDVGAANL